MFAFCFIKQAAAQLRSARKVTTVRGRVVRTVRFGMIGLMILAAAASVQAAGSNSKSLGSFSGKTGSANASGDSQLNRTVSLGGQSNSMGYPPARTVPHGDKKIGGLGNVLNGTTNQTGRINKIDGLKDVVSKKDPTLKINKNLIDAVKKPQIDKKIPGLGDMFGNKGKGDRHDKKFHDYCHDKCFHDCFHYCPWWYCWDFYPIWIPLYHCGCGYWYDVPLVKIVEGVDLQLLAVRLIDSGDAAENQGPAYRVWVRNNSHVAILHPFNVLALTARDGRPASDLPQAGVRVDAIEAGQIIPVDIRLPVAASSSDLPMLHVLVDSHREIAEVYEDNNGAVLNRADILPVGSMEGASAVAVR